jgi:hypothetical protein
MLIILQTYCLFFSGIALVLLPGQLLEMFQKPSFEALKNVTFTVLTILATAVIVGLVQINNTGIF